MKLPRFLIQVAVNAVAFYVAITILSGNGIEPRGENIWLNYLVLGIIFGVVNAILRPILTLLGCPLIILSLGLGILLINTLLFYLTGWLGLQFGFGFTVAGFWPAFWGALIVSVVGMFFNWLFRSEMKD
jgi:putative membrane protein